MEYGAYIAGAGLQQEWTWEGNWPMRQIETKWDRSWLRNQDEQEQNAGRPR